MTAASPISRPTPGDPMPQAAEAAGVPSAKRKNAPPELGTDAIAVLEGRTFMYSDARGDVPAGSVGGLVHADTRFVSTWCLNLNGQPMNVLRSGSVDYYSASFFLANPPMPGLPANSIAARRRRFVGNGLREEIGMFSFLQEPATVDLRLSIGADFADLFEIKDEVRDRSAETTTTADAASSLLTFAYAHETFSAETRIKAGVPTWVEGTDLVATGKFEQGEPPRIEGGDLVWDVAMPARGGWITNVEVTLSRNAKAMALLHSGFGEKRKTPEDDLLARWQSEIPRFHADGDIMKNVFRKSTDDLAALRIEGEWHGKGFVLPAAGLPWFMTLFGRDTLITSYQSMWVGPELARGALGTLAHLQGKVVDDFKDEEPGKIMHEVRTGELTLLGLKPHLPYYGAVDSTPLWIILLSEYWRWTGDDAYVKSFEKNLAAALKWIDEYGDRDGDGYIEYGTRSAQGLGNQCWKDSWDSIQFADGRMPYLPIAISEAQGYVYDAKLRAAELEEKLFGHPEIAKRLRREAAKLRERFNRDFWIEQRGGFYAIGLDADKKPIDTITSNMGHLLWSGIVPDDRATIVAEKLVSDALFSGWGLRTMSNEEKGYNPIGYHLGTVWPHDNSIAALGLSRYGFREEANGIVTAQLEAASYSDHRLPEAFAGFRRDLGRFPVPYPTACSPQAWATGAPFLWVHAMLGLDARDGKVTVDPNVPERLGRIVVHGMHAFGTHYDVEATGTTGSVELTK